MKHVMAFLVTGYVALGGAGIALTLQHWHGRSPELFIVGSISVLGIPLGSLALRRLVESIIMTKLFANDRLRRVA
jgi:hypothetical protein